MRVGQKVFEFRDGLEDEFLIVTDNHEIIYKLSHAVVLTPEEELHVCHEIRHQEIGEQLADDGRIIVRESGTEPLIRIMAEGRDFSVISDMTERLSQKLKEKFRTRGE